MSSPKYNRTFHLPWSPGATNDDKIAASVDSLIGVPIVITEKMDGSNVSLEHNGCFSRSHAGPPTHASFDQLKALHAALQYSIPEEAQFFGEWCYAKHSIEYNSLPNYFMMFGVRFLLTDEDDFDEYYWVSWDSVIAYADGLGLSTVPVLFEGTVKSEKELRELTESLMKQQSVCGGIREGVVVRTAEGFEDYDFSRCILKCVRANHVNTSTHWLHQEIVKNKLKSE